jgi:hypothetical protein
METGTITTESSVTNNQENIESNSLSSATASTEQSIST